MRNTPEMVEVDSTRLDEVLGRVEQALDTEDAALIRAVFASYVYVADLVDDKNTSIRRLRQLFFGARTEKTATVLGRTTDKPDAAPRTGAAATAFDERDINRNFAYDSEAYALLFHSIVLRNDPPGEFDPLWYCSHRNERIFSEPRASASGT